MLLTQQLLFGGNNVINVFLANLNVTSMLNVLIWLEVILAIVIMATAETAFLALTLTNVPPV